MKQNVVMRVFYCMISIVHFDCNLLYKMVHTHIICRCDCGGLENRSDGCAKLKQTGVVCVAGINSKRQTVAAKKNSTSGE